MDGVHLVSGGEQLLRDSRLFLWIRPRKVRGLHWRDGLGGVYLMEFPPCQFRKAGICEVIREQSGKEVQVPLSVCLSCHKTTTPETGAFNHATTSVSLVTIKEDRPEDYPEARRAWGPLIRGDIQEVHLGGPGTQLRALLGRMGFRPCDTCRTYSTTMDRNGPDWCDQNQEKILNWLQNFSNLPKMQIQSSGTKRKQHSPPSQLQSLLQMEAAGLKNSAHSKSV